MRCPGEGSAAALLALAFLAGPLPAQVHPLEPAVDRYLSGYLAGEIEGLRELVSADVVFEDPSMTLSGRDVFVARLTRAFAGFTLHAFDERERIYSGGGHVLVVGDLRMTVHGPLGDSPELDLPFAVSLKLVGGRVVRHVDFVDALEYARQVRGGA